MRNRTRLPSPPRAVAGAALTRRSFLTATGMAAASAAAPRATGGAHCPTSASVDVVVVGAGFAGLAAADALTKQGASVVVVEARDRVGGRTLNGSLGAGKVVELGGQWVGPGQTAILALAQDVGVTTFPTYNTGDNLFYYQGALTSYPANGLPPIPTADLTEFITVVLGELEPLAQQVPLDTPWDTIAVDIRALDGQTLESWKLAHLASPGARFLLDVAVESIFACEPRDISLLFYLFYVRSGGGLLSLAGVTGGAQESRLVGGSQLIAQRVADRLGRVVRLSSPVRRVQDCGGLVVVETERRRFRAGRAIIALAPTLCGRMAYDPPLPGLRDQLTQRFPQGSVIKCEAVYATPFWRDAGLTGQVVSDSGPVGITFDNSPPDGSPGVLLGFIEADEARRWGQRTPADRRTAVLASLATYFGPQALAPTDYLEHDWSADPWTRGCYAGFMPPGVLTMYGPALREPAGRLHWAGTETAAVFAGYMDGAVRSGQRAASEVLAP